MWQHPFGWAILASTFVFTSRGLLAVAAPANEQAAIATSVEAIEAGDADALRSYLDDGGDPNAIDQFGSPLLHVAINVESREMVELLIKHGAAIDLREEFAGMTAFAQACAMGNDELIDLLLAHGADPKAADEFGGTTLEEAAFSGHAELVERLRKLGVASDHPLHVAAGVGDLETVRRLATDEAAVNFPTPGWLNTPLQFAAAAGQTEAMKLLLARGADPNLPSINESFALNYCVGRESATDCELLLKHGAEVNARVGEGGTPLEWSYGGEMTDLLKKHGGKFGEDLPPGPDLPTWWKRAQGIHIDWQAKVPAATKTEASPPAPGEPAKSAPAGAPGP